MNLRLDGSHSQVWYSTLLCCATCVNSVVCLTADGLAYSALLKNELLGAGIEKVLDPQTEDRRLQPSTPERRSLFSVSLSYLLICSFDATWVFWSVFSAYFMCVCVYSIHSVPKDPHPMITVFPRTPSPLLAAKGKLRLLLKHVID